MQSRSQLDTARYSQNGLIRDLITQRSLVQIQPPQPSESTRCGRPGQDALPVSPFTAPTVLMFGSDDLLATAETYLPRLDRPLNGRVRPK